MQKRQKKTVSPLLPHEVKKAAELHIFAPKKTHMDPTSEGCSESLIQL